MKTCNKCGVEKEFSEFYKCKKHKDGFLGGCKPCRKSYYQKHNSVNKDRISKQKKTYREANKDSIKAYREKNKATKKKKAKAYYEANKEKWKLYYKENKEHIDTWRRKYKKANKDIINKKERARRKTEPLYNMKSNLRTRTWIAFRNKGYKKSSKTQEMLGVDWEVCKAHIEKQFTEGMNWDNKDKWHIDHIIPLSSAKNEEELMKLCHYRNLQPLWAEDNLNKKDKLQGQQTYFKL